VPSHVIGLIADTHGLVRPELHQALAGVEIILHAGDVGGDGVLDELELIAPVRAVWGNTDEPGDPRLVGELIHTVDGVEIHVSHGHEVGAPTPDKLLARYPHRVLVYGHTHQSAIVRAGERLVINPGSAGPRRFKFAASIVRLRISANGIDVETLELPG
jgi:uncharacterized protein